MSPACAKLSHHHHPTDRSRHPPAARAPSSDADADDAITASSADAPAAAPQVGSGSGSTVGSVSGSVSASGFGSGSGTGSSAFASSRGGAGCQDTLPKRCKIWNTLNMCGNVVRLAPNMLHRHPYLGDMVKAANAKHGLIKAVNVELSLTISN